MALLGAAHPFAVCLSASPPSRRVNSRAKQTITGTAAVIQDDDGTMQKVRFDRKLPRELANFHQFRKGREPDVGFD